MFEYVIGVLEEDLKICREVNMIHDISSKISQLQQAIKILQREENK